MYVGKFQYKCHNCGHEAVVEVPSGAELPETWECHNCRKLTNDIKEIK